MASVMAGLVPAIHVFDSPGRSNALSRGCPSFALGPAKRRDPGAGHDEGRVQPDIIIIAAVAENGVIGRANALPWRVKSDMTHFRAVTTGKPVVLGRKTFASIGKPLSGRTTIVISRDQNFSAPGIVAAPDFARALASARGEALRRSAEAIVVAGGAEIYA